MAQLHLTGPVLHAPLPALAEAMACLDTRLSTWASNASAYDALLRRVFAAAGTDAATWSQRAEALREQLVSTGLWLPLEILPTGQRNDLLGGYAAACTGGGDVVVLNESWLQGATATQIEAVLLEELGHAIDSRLNGAADSAGDEGELFSALLRGEPPNPSASDENDQRLITIAGTSVAIEAATLSLEYSVTRLPTRWTTDSGNPAIDALLQDSTLTAPAPIRYFFPDSFLLSTADDERNQGPFWALDIKQQAKFRQMIAEWSAVALVEPQQVPSLGEASMSVFGISQGNSNVYSFNGSPVTMQFMPEAGPFQSGGFEPGTILHEMGHALGLKHPFEGLYQLYGEENGYRYTLMAYDTWRDGIGQFINPATPQLYDIAAIQYLYGANTAYHSGNDDYQWGSDEIVFRSLWDGGGEDTINASNQAQFVQIDLNQGSFSEIGRPIFQSTFVEDPYGDVIRTNTTKVNGVPTEVKVRGYYIESERRDNLSIAYGTVIENAIGSEFGDRLQGNGESNYLIGLAGNDTIDGGPGNDSLSGGNGADVYLFGRGSGNDTIYNYDEDSVGTKADTIRLDEGITTTGVTLTRNRFSDDLIISLKGNNDSLTVLDYFSNDGTSRNVVEYLKFADGTVWNMATVKAQLLTSLPFVQDRLYPLSQQDPTGNPIRDFDGNPHGFNGRYPAGTERSYRYQGKADVNGDGNPEEVFTNRVSSRWATVSVDPVTGQIDYSRHGRGGSTRVVGIYSDPLVEEGEANKGFLLSGEVAPKRFGPFDSQQRFQNDLKIDNLQLRAAADYNRDGLMETYWKVLDGTAYLHAYMHADGNIQYSNYQNLQQMTDFLAPLGYANIIPLITA